MAQEEAEVLGIGKQLDCLIITHSGKSVEKLIGIVCMEDIAKYLIN